MDQRDVPTLPDVVLLDQFCCVPYYNSYLTRALERSGARVRLVSVDYHYDTGYFASQGVAFDPGLTGAISRLKLAKPTIRRPVRLVELLMNMVAFALKVSWRRPDVVHVQYLALAERGWSAEIWLLRLLRRLGVPIAYTVHNVLPQSTGMRFMPLYQKIYGMADLLFCHTERAKQELIDRFDITPTQIRVIPMGPFFHDVEKPTVAAARRHLDVDDETVVFLCHGGVKPYKGIEFLLEAWERVAERHSNALLLIAGPGEPDYLAEIRERVEAMKYANAVRLDFRFAPADELPLIFQAADILVYPYKEITGSAALLTGLTFDKPIVATSLPAFEEVLGGREETRLVPYGDIDRLSAALSGLVDTAARTGVPSSTTDLEGDSGATWDAIAEETLVGYNSLLRSVREGRVAR